MQVRQDCAADVACQVGRAGDYVSGASDHCLGGLDSDLEAGPVRVGARGGLHRVGDGDPQCLVQGEQRERFVACPFGAAGEPMYRTGDLAGGRRRVSRSTWDGLTTR